MIKKMLLSTMMVVSGVTMISCNRDDDRINKETENSEIGAISLKEFSLEKTEISVKRGKTEKIRILSGNGNYDYTQNLQVAIINLSKDKEYLEITALQDGGTTSTHVTDIKSGKRIKITIHTTKLSRLI